MGATDMTAPEDHEVLDMIATLLESRVKDWRPVRRSECVEFRDPTTGQWHEIVVRAIDGPSEDDDDEEVDGSDVDEPEKGQPTLVAGWGKPIVSKKWHWFPAGISTSICGNIGFYFGEREAGNDGSSDNCAECRKRKAKHEKVG